MMSTPFIYQPFISEQEKWIAPTTKELQYSGRIDFTHPDTPIFIFPCTSVTTIFTGTSIKIILQNHHQCWDNYLGYLIDGKEYKLLLPEKDNIICITLAEQLEKRKHTLVVFKRMDACHYIRFHGFLLPKQENLYIPEPKPVRKMEFFGNSVTAGEVSEAIDYVVVPDPEHNGEFSNSYYSYAFLTAKKLNAQIHNISQGGIALLNDTGYFNAPALLGMEYITGI